MYKTQQSLYSFSSIFIEKVLFTMLKIILYPTYCNVGTHETFINVVIAITDEKCITKFKHRNISIFTNGFRKLKKYFELFYCFHIYLGPIKKY